ncbi:hypothetical protein KR018_004509, partial [Drosophila ironensis]
VQSEHNPADLASRGLFAGELIQSDLWWKGPAWLADSAESWPMSPMPETQLEERATKVCLLAAAIPADLSERFSNLSRAIRVTAFVSRFIRRCQKPGCQVSTELDSEELKQAEQRLIRCAQRHGYPDEYACLVNPFLDPHGVLRACGRIRASESLSYDERHPILLPYNSNFTRMLVRSTHQTSLHGGNQLVTRLVRARFWVPRLRTLVKSVIHACRVCVVYRKRTQTQLMGALPVERVTFSRPFTHTGVDFAGPFDIKNYTGRACLITKGYVCVFVCFSTRAIHLEATSDLTTDKFLAAFSRF